MPITVAGSGWLRTAASSSSTARYTLVCGQEYTVRGQIQAELSTMIEAASARRATLVLESGRSVDVSVLQLSADELSVQINREHAARLGIGKH